MAVIDAAPYIPVLFLHVGKKKRKRFPVPGGILFYTLVHSRVYTGAPGGFSLPSVVSQRLDSHHLSSLVPGRKMCTL